MISVKNYVKSKNNLPNIIKVLIELTSSLHNKQQVLNELLQVGDLGVRVVQGRAVGSISSR